MLRTQIYLKIEKQTPQTEKTYKSREHKSALGHPEQEHQVTTTNTFINRKIPRINSKPYAQTGAYRINHPCPSPRETYRKTHKEYNALIKVDTKNEYPYTKETATQEITSPGPKYRTMNKESYTTPSNKLPDQIFDTQEVPNQEPSEPRAGMSDFEKMMEYPFACSICRVAFAKPQDLENHVVLNHRRSTPDTHGAHDLWPGSSISLQGIKEKADTDPKADSQETFEIPETPTQVATHEMAPGGEVEEEPMSDPLAPPREPRSPENNCKPPTQVATPRSAPGLEAEVESRSDASAISWGTSHPGDSSREFVKGFQVLHVSNTRKPRTPNPKSDSEELPNNPPDKSVAENTGKTEKTENEEDMEARAKPHKEHLKASEPQPMTQSCVVEVQNTGPLITDMDLQSNEPNTGGRGGQDDVEGIIDPLNKTKIDDQQKPDLTNISEV